MPRRPAPVAPLEIAGFTVEPGSQASLRIPVARRYTHADLYLPAFVVHGRKPGPRLFVSAAIHGDEICGVEIIRRLLRSPGIRRIAGTLIAVPVVNVYGFVTQTRYLPDRRDLNRSFPGSPKGSLAARLAHRFMEEVVAHASHGIDLHTGALHRSNLPQIRACLADAETERLAHAFGAPVILDANVRDGSLRQAALEHEIPMLVYEGGEALRFDEFAIRAGLRGVRAVMAAIGMLAPKAVEPSEVKPYIARSSVWVRAPESGILRHPVRLGSHISRGERLGVLSNPLGDEEIEVVAPRDGVLIGRNNLPLVHEGDALFHLATFERPSSVAEQVGGLREELDPSGAGSGLL